MASRKWLLCQEAFIMFGCSLVILENENMTAFIASPTDGRNNVIAHYFSQGLTGEEIRNVLRLHHDMPISLRHLRRILAKIGLQRRQHSNEADVRRCMQLELSGSGSGLGYRAMKHRLELKYSLRTTRNRVMKLLQEIDPVGVDLRRKHCLRRRSYYNKGPNYMIHIDGYDKIKPYGFAIHGGIDGYSRRMLWLQVGTSNNDPHVVASYFMDYVQSIEGVPRVLRVDAGSENTVVTKIQKAFRWNANDAWSRHRSVIVGSSKSNQRIERWWGILRRQAIQYWINLFKDMEQMGVLTRENGLEKYDLFYHIHLKGTKCTPGIPRTEYTIDLALAVISLTKSYSPGPETTHIGTGSPRHFCEMELLRFCLMRTIQSDLDTVMEEWNLHRIRPSRNLETVPGKPNSLYYMPSINGTIDYKTQVDIRDIQAIRRDYCCPPTTYGCSNDIANAVLTYMQEERLAQPNSRQEALELYGFLHDNKDRIQVIL